MYGAELETTWLVNCGQDEETLETTGVMDT